MSAKPKTARLSDDQRFDWLRLIRSENVGPRTFLALVNSCGGARAALAALPDLSRRGGLRRPIRVATPEEVERELVLARNAGVRFIALGEPEYPPALRQIELGAADPGLARPRGGLAATRHRDRRLAQRLGCGLGLRRSARERPGAGGLRRRLGTRARHRSARSSGLAGDGHDRRARGRPQPSLSARGGGAAAANRRIRRGHFRNAGRVGAARARFSAPQPAGLRARARHCGGRGRTRIGLAHHGQIRRRAELRGVRRAGIAVGPARGGDERPASPGRRDLRARRGRAGDRRSAPSARPVRRFPRGYRRFRASRCGASSRSSASIPGPFRARRPARNSTRRPPRSISARRRRSYASKPCWDLRRFRSTNSRGPPRSTSGASAWRSSNWTWPDGLNIPAATASRCCLFPGNASPARAR